jgi:membrane-bound ClpP family serine protease
MSDPNRRTMGPEEPAGRGLRLGLLITGLVLVVGGIILIAAVPDATTPGVVVGAIGIVIVIAGPIFGRRRPPAA